MGLLAQHSYIQHNLPATVVLSLLAPVNVFRGIRRDGCRYDSRILPLDNFLCWVMHASRVLTDLAAVDPTGEEIVEATQKCRKSMNGMQVKMLKVTPNHDREKINVSEGCTIELFRPKSPTKPLPILLFFHGGGHCIGTAEDFIIPEHLKTFKDELIIASVEYRTAPETSFPSAALDAIAALEYVHSRATELGGSPDGICLSGISA